MDDLPPRLALKEFRPTGPQKTAFHYFRSCPLLAKRSPKEVVEVSVVVCAERGLSECGHCTKALIRAANPGVKRCPVCTETLPLDQFHRNSRTSDGRGGYCKPCTRTKLKDWSAKNDGRLPELMRRNLLKKYGLTPSDYAEMYEKQKGLCAVCKRSAEEFVYGLAIDHDHFHNKVRGLLCGPCNTALGSLQDSPEVVYALFLYIQHHQDRLWWEDDDIDTGEQHAAG